MPRRSLIAAAAAAAALLLAAPAGAAGRAPAHRADGRLADWRGAPTMLAGRTQISRGELIYTDWLYDDYGPDLDGAPNLPAFRAKLAPTVGDYRYPAEPDRYGYNAADLRELRIAADRRGLHAVVFLQTMKVADAAAATIAIDTDGDAKTGAARWPDGAGIDTPGADRFITVWGTGGRVTDAAGATSPVRQAANLRRNAIEVDVPWSALGAIARTARVWVVTGLARPGGGGYMPQREGATAIFNVGFRGDDEWDRFLSHWGETTQAKALAKRDVARFSYPLSIGALRRRRTVPFRLAPGFYNRIFRSRESYGEGILLKDAAGASGDSRPQFLSRYQPYGLWIPKGYTPGRPTPLLLNGHSLDVNQNEYRMIAQNQLRQLGDERGSIIITPLARGMDTWYLDAGLYDVFEAWRDVRRAYSVDEERTSITGYSMGGYMTYRLGLLMPDAFARASVYVGPPAFYFWPYPGELQSEEHWRVRGNTNLIVRNALDLPFEIVHGNADELVPIGGVVHQADTFRAQGNPYRFFHHQADDHLSFIVGDSWSGTKAWLGDARRDLRPTHVRYRRYPSMDLPHYGLVFDGAYWVDGIEVRDGAAVDAWGEVEATTLARGGYERRPVAGTMAAPAADGRSPAVLSEQRIENGAPLEKRNGFDLKLTNVRALRLDTTLMGLDTAAPIAAILRGDGPTRIALAGRFARGAVARLDDAPLPLDRERGAVTVTVELRQGTASRLELSPAPR